MSTVLASPPPLIEYPCPVCLRRGMWRLLVRAAHGAIVEAHCRSCKYREVIMVE